MEVFVRVLVLPALIFFGLYVTGGLELQTVCRDHMSCAIQDAVRAVPSVVDGINRGMNDPEILWEKVMARDSPN